MPGPTNLEETLSRIALAEDNQDKQVTVRAVIDELGRRAFGPLLLLPGLLTLMPTGGIPGLPTVMSALILLISFQLLCGRRSFWLPNWLLDRAVSRDKLDTSQRWMRRPARVIDSFLRPRFSVLIEGYGVYAIAILSVTIAIMMPPMELIPFSALGAGLALTLFGLALIAQDGVVALLGIATTLATLVLMLNLAI